MLSEYCAWQCKLQAWTTLLHTGNTLLKIRVALVLLRLRMGLLLLMLLAAPPLLLLGGPGASVGRKTLSGHAGAVQHPASLRPAGGGPQAHTAAPSASMPFDPVLADTGNFAG